MTGPLICYRAALSTVMGVLRRFVPVTSSGGAHIVKLDVNAGELRLTVGDGLGLAVQTQINLALTSAGPPWSFSVALHPLAQLISMSSSAEIELRLIGEQLVIESGAGRASLPGEDSPANAAGRLTPLPDVVGAELPLDALRHLWETTAYAVSPHSVQAVFRGLCLTHTGTQIQMVSSDGFRLATCRLPHSGSAFSAIIPPRPLGDVIKLAAVLGEERLSLTVQDGAFWLHGANLSASISLIDGQYPSYERVIPAAAAPLRAQVSAAALFEEVRRVSLLSDSSANNRVTLKLLSDRIDVFAAGQYGQASGTVAAVYNGAALEVGFNAPFLLSALQVCRGDALLSGHGKTGAWKVEDAASTGVVGVVVPLRI